MSRRAIGAPIIPVPIHAISMFVTAFSAPPSERSGQVAAAVDHADDFDFRDRTIIGIRLGPVENEVRSFEQDTRGGMDIRAARPHSWVINQHSPALSSMDVNNRSAAAGLSSPMNSYMTSRSSRACGRHLRFGAIAWRFS